MVLTANLHFSGATNEKETKNTAAKDGLVQLEFSAFLIGNDTALKNVIIFKPVFLFMLLLLVVGYTALIFRIVRT